MNPAIVVGAVALAGLLVFSMREGDLAVAAPVGLDVEAEIVDTETGTTITTVITGASDADLDTLGEAQEEEIFDQQEASEEEGYGLAEEVITEPRFVIGTPDYTAVLRA